MSKKKIYHQNERDFLRYSSGKMSGEERNSFEKNLQKDPFLADATEGYENLTSEEISQDLQKLHSAIQDRTRQSGFKIYKIAAALAAFILVSSLFYYLSQRSVSESAGIRTITKLEEQKTVEKEDFNSEPANNTLSDSQTSQESIPDNNILRNEAPAHEKKSSTLVKRSKEENFPEQPIPGEMENDAMAMEETDNERTPGSTIQKKELYIRGLADTGSASGKKMNLPERVQGMIPSYKNRDEAVIIGYGSAKKSSAGSKIAGEEKAPGPVGGIKALEDYIRENTIFPEVDEEIKSAIIVLELNIGKEGRPEDITVLSSPDTAFSMEAIRLLNSGPAWESGESQGKKISDKVTIILILRKETGGK